MTNEERMASSVFLTIHTYLLRVYLTATTIKERTLQFFIFEFLFGKSQISFYCDFLINLVLYVIRRREKKIHRVYFQRFFYLIKEVFVFIVRFSSSWDF
jgi:hypothetical protein